MLATRIRVHSQGYSTVKELRSRQNWAEIFVSFFWQSNSFELMTVNDYSMYCQVIFSRAVSVLYLMLANRTDNLSFLVSQYYLPSLSQMRQAAFLGIFVDALECPHSSLSRNWQLNPDRVFTCFLSESITFCQILFIKSPYDYSWQQWPCEIYDRLGSV